MTRRVSRVCVQEGDNFDNRRRCGARGRKRKVVSSLPLPPATTICGWLAGRRALDKHNKSHPSPYLYLKSSKKWCVCSQINGFSFAAHPNQGTLKSSGAPTASSVATCTAPIALARMIATTVAAWATEAVLLAAVAWEWEAVARSGTTSMVPVAG